jgi:hypothetical protein
MAGGPFTIEMPKYKPSDAVSAKIIAWERGRLAVEYCYPGGATEAGPIRPEDWLEIDLDSKARLSDSATAVQAH